MLIEIPGIIRNHRDDVYVSTSSSRSYLIVKQEEEKRFYLRQVTETLGALGVAIHRAKLI